VAAEELATLLRHASAGDLAAFPALYDATSARVYGLAVRIVRCEAQAEEVAQEAFLEIWRTSRRFDATRGTAISWILMITHAAAVNRVRSAQARTNREERYRRQTSPNDRLQLDVTHDLVHASFEAARVHDALAQLPQVQREALELAYFGGCTYADVAVRLGVPLGTAKTRIRDGLLRLRDLLGDPCAVGPCSCRGDCGSRWIRREDPGGDRLHPLTCP